MQVFRASASVSIVTLVVGSASSAGGTAPRASNA